MPRKTRGAGLRPDPFDPLDGRPDDTLDLHGFTAAEARARLEHYFRTARPQRAGQLVHIITGKGRTSSGGPVLRPAVGALLRSGALPHIAQFGRDDDEGGYLVRIAGFSSR